MRNGHVAAANKQHQRSSETKARGHQAMMRQKRREMHEVMTSREVAVAGLDPGGVAAEEAAERGGAVPLQPCPQQLHPLLQNTTEAVSRKVGRNSCLFLREEGYSHRGLWPGRSEASG
jgi:hypothetical protein